jgi:two-component system, chemotaxis family, sensor kinase CheA
MAAVLRLDPGTSGATPRKAGSKPRTKARAGLSFGKYREIIIAVAFFLLFDLGVLC